MTVSLTPGDLCRDSEHNAGAKFRRMLTYLDKGPRNTARRARIISELEDGMEVISYNMNLARAVMHEGIEEKLTNVVIESSRTLQGQVWREVWVREEARQRTL